MTLVSSSPDDKGVTRSWLRAATPVRAKQFVLH
jgi:hypothetical protein